VTTARNPPGSRPPSEPVSTNPGAPRGKTGAPASSNGNQLKPNLIEMLKITKYFFDFIFRQAKWCSKIPTW